VVAMVDGTIAHAVLSRSQDHARVTGNQYTRDNLRHACRPRHRTATRSARGGSTHFRAR
jgi:hypothetical protein